MSMMAVKSVAAYRYLDAESFIRVDIYQRRLKKQASGRDLSEFKTPSIVDTLHRRTIDDLNSRQSLLSYLQCLHRAVMVT
jgi:hypothetical protein